jgi:uncharacterized membrane protein YvbJ
MTYCGKCGKENPDGQSYCYKCGSPLINEPTPGIVQSQGSKNISQKSYSKIVPLTILVMSFVVIIAIFALYVFLNSPPVSTHSATIHYSITNIHSQSMPVTISVDGNQIETVHIAGGYTYSSEIHHEYQGDSDDVKITATSGPYIDSGSVTLYPNQSEANVSIEI